MAPSLHPLSLTVLSTLLPLTNALGCYTDGGWFGGAKDATFTFQHLHSNPTLYSNELWVNQRDMVPEVYADIATHCHTIAGTQVVSGAQTWWTACSDWAYTDKDDTCVSECNSSCGWGGGGSSAIMNCVGKCIRECPFEPQLAVFPGDDAGNHLDWAMAHDGHGGEARTLSYDACVAGFKNVHNSCERGGEMESDGFWFKLDPNTKTCDHPLS